MALLPIAQNTDTRNWSALFRSHVLTIPKAFLATALGLETDEWLEGIKRYFLCRYTNPTTPCPKGTQFDGDDASTRLAFALASLWRGISRAEMMELIETIEVVGPSSGNQQVKAPGGWAPMVADPVKMAKVRYWLSELRSLRVYTQMLGASTHSHELERRVLLQEGPVVQQAIGLLERLVAYQLTRPTQWVDQDSLGQFC